MRPLLTDAVAALGILRLRVRRPLRRFPAAGEAACAGRADGDSHFAKRSLEPDKENS